MKSIKIESLASIDKAAQEFIKLIGNHKVFAFYGEMGAGKTTFIKEICIALGVTDAITSPTFAIVNEYKSGANEKIFHFDFYRVNKIEEVFDFGYEDYFYSGALCFIEWPERVETLLPEDCVFVEINVNEDGSRDVSVK